MAVPSVLGCVVGDSACVVAANDTSIRQVRHDPLPEHRRRPAPAGRGGRVRRRRACCPARPSCRQRTRPAGSRSAGRSRCCATRAWSTPARASAGSSPPTRCARPSAGSAPSRRQLADVGRALRAPDPRLRVRRRRRPGCAQVLGRDTVLRGAAPQPGRRRAVRPGDGVVPRGARRRAVAGPTSSASPFYELLGVPLGGADADASARRGRGRRTPSCSACRSGSPVLRCERVTRVASTASRCCVSEHVFPGPPHRVRGRPAPRRAVDRRPAPRPPGARLRLGAAGAAAQPGRRRALRPRHRVVPRGVRRRAEPGRRGALTVLRAARRPPGWRHPDDRCGGGLRVGGRAAPREGGLAAAALRAASPARSTATRCCSPSTSSPPTSRCSRSTCPTSRRRSPPPASASSSSAGVRPADLSRPAVVVVVDAVSRRWSWWSVEDVARRRRGWSPG